MSKYPAIENILQSIFSVEVGLEKCEALDSLGRELDNERHRIQIEEELLALLKDSSISWVEFLDNDGYCVYPADDEVDAKQFFIELIWNRVFPEQTPP